VAFDDSAVLILGASGRGKSGLALQLMALGAGLVADDRTLIWLHDATDRSTLMADSPDTLRGLIEARGVGILRAAPVGPRPVALVVDLDRVEEARLPEERSLTLLGRDLPLLHMVDTPSFPGAILQYVKGGRHA
jgi:HPr kinase/phosphorylase